MSSITPKDRRPMARVSQIPLFQREIREHLNFSAFEILLAGARVLSEGQMAQQDATSPIYYGSTMVTLDLGRSSAHLRGPLDASAAEKLMLLCRHEDRVKDRLFDVARKEARRLAATNLSDWDIELRVTRKGNRILIDLDVEARAEISARAVR